ncbi:O-acetyl-ADP-ribose deacetylase (regulator of RNase III), contains Macro domain [Neorhodopirellula lusitana]|uniref:O-acetyl-ADP-ribose deacetylase (Regulator of RNase III), contains Macro domain n=1 Tax=Neorhodopirellula lusitana TaxID=445327 RepID=A0ABY1Q5G1_9BACT|nr:macro domain-containing protein [Neorhodopirellula lusitana]SMP60249.1 O-acetyl-ADP-ribose deacetylase (regulator of RNase III), contains Macro domain [Neorhodopirellula lusitana]
MKIHTRVGDVLKVAADVLISTANPWLNLSGGVNGAILSAVGPKIQEELHAYLKSQANSAVSAGSVVRSRAGNLPFHFILHAVAIDPFYDSSIELVRKTVVSALDLAIKAGAKTISTPTLATGYGPMSIADFGTAIAPLASDLRFDGLSLTIVVRKEEHRSELSQAISAARTEV